MKIIFFVLTVALGALAVAAAKMDPGLGQAICIGSIVGTANFLGYVEGKLS